MSSMMRSPAAKMKINENIPLIKISNSIQKHNNINHTKKKQVGHHRKRSSKELLTDNDITTANIQKK